MDILNFWFPNEGFQKFWFDKSVDEYIKTNYLSYLNYYETFEINPEILSDEDILKIIILLDQFTRNIYRNDKLKKNHKKALDLAEYFFKNRIWINTPINKLIFYLMPFRHTESIDHYDFIFYILNQMNISKLNSKEKYLFNKFYKITNFKYTNLVNYS